MLVSVQRFSIERKIIKEHCRVNLDITDNKLGLYGPRYQYITEGIVEDISLGKDSKIRLTVVVRAGKNDLLRREIWLVGFKNVDKIQKEN